MSTGNEGEVVVLGQREPQPILSVRAKALVAELGETQGERLASLSGYASQHGIRVTGAPFVRYHTFEEIETDVETGIPVSGAAAGEGRILAGELPGGPAISTWHDGPDQRLGEAYARLGAWLHEHGREADGPAWEVYEWLDPAEATVGIRRTQLVQPIR